MHPKRATWRDVEDALALEAELLGGDVAWDLDRARQWWDSGVETAFAIRNRDHLVAYACVMHLNLQAYEDIVGGRLDPSNLELAHTSLDSGHHWLGIVVTHPAYRNRGLGATVLASLCDDLSGNVVADVYSEQGRALLERAGWVLVRESEHPIYTLEISRTDTR